jgi:hypothetical protein
MAMEDKARHKSMDIDDHIQASWNIAKVVEASKISISLENPCEAVVQHPSCTDLIAGKARAGRTAHKWASPHMFTAPVALFNARSALFQDGEGGSAHAELFQTPRNSLPVRSIVYYRSSGDI